FYEYSGDALLYAVRQALHHYMDERIWKRIQLNGMTKDFSWKGPAKEYASLYQAARLARGFAPTVAKVVKTEKVEKAERAEKVEKTEKEPEAEKPLRRSSGKATKAAEQSAAQGSGQNPQGTGETDQRSGQTLQEPSQTAEDSVKGA